MLYRETKAPTYLLCMCVCTSFDSYLVLYYGSVLIIIVEWLQISVECEINIQSRWVTSFARRVCVGLTGSQQLLKKMVRDYSFYPFIFLIFGVIFYDI